MQSNTVSAADASLGNTPNWLGWGLLILCLGLLGYIFYDGLDLMVQWWDRDEYSHGYMIPLVAAFLVWQKLDQIPKVMNGGAWTGVLFTIASIVVFFMGELGSLYTIIQYAALLSLYAIVLSAFGWRGTLLLWAPLLYLIFMIPLPNFLYFNLSNYLQLISSEIGVFVIRLFDISVYLEGNVIDLGVYQLQVVEACSGLRYLFPLMSFGFLIAYVFRGPFWQKAIIFLSTVPITVLMNSFRIGVIGVTVEWWGIEMAEGFLHDFEGWVIFMGCIGILVLEMAIFIAMSKSREKVMDRLNLDGPATKVSLSDFRFNTSLFSPLVLTTAVLLGSAIGLQWLNDREEIQPDRKSFTEFPLFHKGWIGREVALTEEVLNTLKLTDYIQANYTNSQYPIPVNFYSAYYASQSKGASIHSPKSCLPGGGWILSGMREKTFPDIMSSEGKPLVVNRALMKKGSSAQIVYYWFEQRGRNITDEYAAKWYMFVDALTINRTDGALLRVVVPVPDVADIDEYEAIADQFMQDMYPIMDEYFPGKNN